jgi:hypothetical protein
MIFGSRVKEKEIERGLLCSLAGGLLSSAGLFCIPFFFCGRASSQPILRLPTQVHGTGCILPFFFSLIG